MYPMPLLGLSAAFKHGPRQAWAVQVLLRAIASAGLSGKEAAAMQDLTEPQWSRQAKNADGAHVSYQRLFEFPASVLMALGKELYEEFSNGGKCVEPGELLRLVNVTVRLADAVEARPQLRMDLTDTQHERRSA